MIVCSCNVLTDKAIRTACHSERPRTTGEVYGCLGCSPQCGRCARTIKTILDQAWAASARPAARSARCLVWRFRFPRKRSDKPLGFYLRDFDVSSTLRQALGALHLLTPLFRTGPIYLDRNEGESGMKGDPKVIDYLNKGLRSELTAINQYWLHYRILDNWGLKNLAKKWKAESIEEMHHADKFAERILFLDGFPNMQVLDPLRIGQDVKEILEADLAAEVDARSLYQEAATYCHAVKDYVSRDLFEELMKDEEHHIDFLEEQLDLVAKLGVQLYSQHHIGKLDDD
jgi:bacterioferritin